MATRKMSLLEKMASNLGVLYRYHASQFPRRWEILKAVGKHELAPPKTTDWPIIKAEWQKVSLYIQSQQYRNLTLREFLVYSAVAIEVASWFFIGEMIGRRYIFGYLVPADYISKATLKKVKEQESEVKLLF